MKTNQRSLRGIAKAMVALFAIGSMLVVTAGPAMAENDERTWTITVSVEDNRSEQCVEEGGSPADWSPDTGMVGFDSADRIDLDIDNPIVGFYVFLNFYPQLDSCFEFFADPPGTVEASFVGLSADLAVSTLDCSGEVGCSPAELEGYNRLPGPPGSGQLAGSLDFTNASEGLYEETLKVTWTLD